MSNVLEDNQTGCEAELIKTDFEKLEVVLVSNHIKEGNKMPIRDPGLMVDIQSHNQPTQAHARWESAEILS